MDLFNTLLSTELQITKFMQILLFTSKLKTELKYCIVLE